MTTWHMSEDGSDCSILEEIIAVHTLHLPPKYLGNISTGIKEVLASFLLKYSEDLKAVPIVFTKADSNISDSSPVLYDNPCVHVDVRVRWLALVPKPGSRTFATVSNQGPEHLGLLLLNYFNVTIQANQLKSKYKWNEEDVCWSSINGMPLSVGDKVEFEILSCVNEGDMVVIFGSIDKLSAIDAPKSTPSSWTVTSSDSKKRKSSPSSKDDKKKKKKSKDQ